MTNWKTRKKPSLYRLPKKHLTTLHSELQKKGCIYLSIIHLITDFVKSRSIVSIISCMLSYLSASSFSSSMFFSAFINKWTYSAESPSYNIWFEFV